MKHVKKSVLIEHSPRQMYELVTAVADYPRFLPWCVQAEVLEATAETTLARLSLSYLGVRQSFTTRNRQVPGERVELELVDGPFSALHGIWAFAPLPADAGPDAPGCRIDYEMHYAFANPLLDGLISPVFDRIAATLIDSFVKRADQVYAR